MTALANIVAGNLNFFAGAVRESPESLQKLEVELGVALPAEVRWFWLSCGSGQSRAAPSAHESLEGTKRYRAAINLPIEFVVLEDRNDAGSVFLDTHTGAVTWVDAHAVPAFASGTVLPTEQDRFATFAAWVEDCLEQARE